MDTESQIPESPAPKTLAYDKPWLWIALAVVATPLIVGGLIFSSWGADAGNDGDDRNSSGADDGDGVTVIYTVSDTGGGPVSLTYENADGNTEQIDAAETTWEKRLTMQPGDFVYVSAQRGPGTGRVRCTITIDGDKAEQAESNGEFVIATCDGSVGH